MKKNLVLIFISGLIFCQCTLSNRTDKSDAGNDGLQMAIRMADSEMTFFPKCSMVDFDPEGKWNYTGGLIAICQSLCRPIYF